MRRRILHAAIGFVALLAGLVLAPLLAAKADCESGGQLFAVLGVPALTALAVGVNVYLGAPAGRTGLLLAAALGLPSFVVPCLLAGVATLAHCAG
jgi:hypothetical protein